MSIFNRTFAVIIAALWCAVLAGFLFLMWAPDRSAEIDFPNFQVTLDVATSGAERVLGTLIVLALIAVGLGLLAWEIAMWRRAARAEEEAAAHAESAAVPVTTDELQALRSDLRSIDARLEEIDRQLHQMPSPDTVRAAVMDSGTLQSELQRIAAYLDDIRQEMRQRPVMAEESGRAETAVRPVRAETSEPVEPPPADGDQPNLLRRIWGRFGGHA